MKKIFAALLLSLFIVTPVVAADSVTIFLAFLFYKDNNVERTVVVGGTSMTECQEIFKAFLDGINTGNVQQDFSVAACKGYSLSDLPRS